MPDTDPDHAPSNARSHLLSIAPVVALAVLSIVGTACSTGSSADRDDTDKTRSTETASTDTSSVETFEVDGLTVLHRPTPANQVVSAKLYIDGGVTNFSDDRAGIEQLALGTAVNGGTDSTPKDAFNSALNATGSSVGYSAGRDYSSYSLRTVIEHVDKTWPLFAEAIAEPAFPEGEFETQREQQIASVRQISENPNRLLGYTARKLMAGDHPYRRVQHGTVEALQSIDRSDIRDYHESLLNPDRMLLVVVGDLSTEDVRSRAQSLRKRLPASESYDRPDLPEIGTSDEQFSMKQKSLPTNYILGMFTAPDPTAEDYPALVLGLEYLATRFFEEVRTKRNLSYAVSAGLQGHRSAYGILYVSTDQPETTLNVMYDEIDKLKEEPLSNQKLRETRNVFITEHYMGMETNAGLAASLARAELIGGDWRRHFSFLERYRAVTPKQIHDAVNQHLGDFRYAVVGNTKSIDKSIFRR